MRFTKMHGLGNDYIYVNGAVEAIADPAALSRVIADRHTGIGSDGLIVLHPSRLAAIRMEMYNADGSRGRMCGNGIRCVAKYVVDRGMAPGPVVRVETDAGIRTCECRREGGRVSAVRVDMGEPSFSPAELPSTMRGDRIVDALMEAGGAKYKITCISMGNPHAVVFVEELHRVDLVTVGPFIENAPQFPERINAHFVRVDSPAHVTIRTWERGSGATRACGTGACAVCVAGAVTGRTQRRIVAELPGGELEVEWSADNHVFMTGPAAEVFSGDWDPR